MQLTFDDWTRRRALHSWGTNAGAEQLPFQTWRHFKEAFAPEIVARAVRESDVPVSTCVDPFGGSGTTALACQFLGVHPITIEVNPFLADLIESKLVAYNADALASDLGSVIRMAASTSKTVAEDKLKSLPPTFVEPGVKGRWIFDYLVAERVGALLTSIDAIDSERHRRLFRVLLAGILVDVSNVVINGKGRRYRKGWEQRRKDPTLVFELFCRSVKRAIGEIHRSTHRLCTTYEIRRGDSRSENLIPGKCDLAVFSPPYPNSFDYTDVYNIELWMLGYLEDREDNQSLRLATMCSHVQTARDFPTAPQGSENLDQTLSLLCERQEILWDPRIPQMVGGYFSDLIAVLSRLRSWMSRGGSAWIVIGDSRYANVQIETARIVADLAPNAGWTVEAVEPCRSMRSSAQQGGRFELAETLVLLRS